MLYIHDGSPLWWEIFRFLHISLQGAVILLAPGKRVVCRDLLPGFVAGKREWTGWLVLKEALQVSLSQFGGVLYSKGIKPLLFFVHVAFPKLKLQVADLGATVFVAGTQKSYKSADNDNAPAQNLQKQTMLSVSDCRQGQQRFRRWKLTPSDGVTTECITLRDLEAQTSSTRVIQSLLQISKKAPVFVVMQYLNSSALTSFEHKENSLNHSAVRTRKHENAGSKMCSFDFII